ncbi:uncharacterized protein LOC143287286 [Babylonia areolata]|uniref:uncharacterized protein LOC143287286 n=1 Tax=Babylonia areolata TaxID=304850 RepID=UPI003FD5078B
MHVWHWIFWAALGVLMWRPTLAEEAPPPSPRRESSNRIDALPGEGQDISSGHLAVVLDRLTSLDRSVAQLKEQVSQLVKVSAEDRAHRVLHDLEGVCEELRAAHITPQPSATTASSVSEAASTTDNIRGQAHNCPPQLASGQLMVTKVMQEETETSYIVTVCYSAPEQPRVFFNVRGNRTEQPMENADFGVVTALRHKSNSSDYVSLGIGFKLHHQYLYISLALHENSTDQILFPDIHVDVEPGNEIVYEPGSEVDITMNVINGVDPELGRRENTRTSLFMRSHTEEDTVDFYRWPGNPDRPQAPSDIRLTETIHSADNTTLLLHVPHSLAQTGGLVKVDMVTWMGVNCPFCLVEVYYIRQTVLFYPSTQSGVFPENAVGFVKERYLDSDEDEDHILCYEDMKLKGCFLSCWVAGDDPSISLSKVGSAPVSSYSENLRENKDYFASVSWRFLNFTMDDAGDYVCQGRSRDGNHVITRTITVEMGKVAKFVRSLTRKTAFQNGSLLVECTAQGATAPTMSIGPYEDYQPNPFLDEADVTVTQLNDTTSQLTFLLPDWRTYESHQLYNIYCRAGNSDITTDWEYINIEDVL